MYTQTDALHFRLCLKCCSASLRRPIELRAQNYIIYSIKVLRQALWAGAPQI